MPDHSPADSAARLVATLRDLLPARRPLGLNEPEFGGDELANLQACIASGWVSSSGTFVDRFERGIETFTGIPHAIATVNGTSALHLCLEVAGVGAGDEVLVPSLTFVGTVNPVCHLGAVPHLIDVEAATLGADPDRLADHLAHHCEMRDGTCINATTGRRVAALVAVHCLGHPCRADALAELCTRHGLSFIEDAAESLGSYRDGRHTGGWGRLSALSFNGNKIITTGGGGAVLTTDTDLAQRVRHLATTAKLSHAWEFVHDCSGYNFRLPNLNAALGCAQLDDLPRRLEQRRRAADRLAAILSADADARLQPEPANCRSNHWLHLVLLADAGERDRVLEQAHAEGLGLRPLWRPLHLQTYLADCPAMPCPVAEDLYRRGVCLPAVLAE